MSFGTILKLNFVVLSEDVFHQKCKRVKSNVEHDGLSRVHFRTF